MNLLSKYVTPMMGYYICDHYVGNEPHMSEASIPLPSKNDILKTKNVNVLANEIVYVQVDYFDHFAKNVFPDIANRFYLVTGQWNLPALKRSALTDAVLEHPKVIAWMSQNPVYQHHPKYMGMPYGVSHKAVGSYDEIRNRGLEISRQILTHQWCNPDTNPERARLIPAGWLTQIDFYEKLRTSRFVISPAGDRDDCYRHLEAIGLGCRPISNANEMLRDVYSSSMMPASINEMNTFIQSPELLCDHSSQVNPENVFASHWIQKLRRM
jgi:hypothetical protein